MMKRLEINLKGRDKKGKIAKRTHSINICVSSLNRSCVSSAILTEKGFNNLFLEYNMGRFRIRKMTPKECFRLMDVSEEDIAKIQSAGISKTGQYKLAGNSIVVGVMTRIFENLFVNQGKHYERGEQMTMF